MQRIPWWKLDQGGVSGENAADIGGTCGGADPGGFQDEPGRFTQIVPDDCIANPDPTSMQPCTNYANLIIPR